MNVNNDPMIISLTILSNELGISILFLNSSSACFDHMPAEVFYNSASLRNLINSLILLLSIAAFSRLNFAFAS
jgi:hypothetical protein